MIEYWWTWVGLSAVAFTATVILWRITRRLRSRGRGWRWGVSTAVGVLLIVSLLLAIPGTYFCWAQNRSLPSPVRRDVVAGVAYERIVHRAPRPMVVHVMTIDLSTPGLQFVVTSRTAGGQMPLSARTTGAFAREFDCDAAINANYFRPFRSNAPWDYYPRAGDPCDVIGIAASAGDVYGPKPWRGGVVYLSADNRVTIDEPPPADIGLYNAIAGAGVLVRDGQVIDKLATDGLALKPYPRAAITLNAARTHMTWVVIDGKQLGYSEGATLAEFATILVKMGAATAIRLDEGGSATMVGRDEHGQPCQVLSTPSNTRIIGRERPVANHLGLRVRESTLSRQRLADPPFSGRACSPFSAPDKANKFAR